MAVDFLAKWPFPVDHQVFSGHGRGGKKQSGEEFERRSFFSSQQCDAFEGGLSPPQRLPWLRTGGLLNLIRDPNISQEIDYLKCLTFVMFGPTEAPLASLRNVEKFKEGTFVVYSLEEEHCQAQSGKNWAF